MQQYLKVIIYRENPMRPIYDIASIHIEITNACNKECACCTRFCGHHKKPFFMNLETVEKALQSLVNFPHNVGIMGGEPTIHPQFADICHLLARHIPKERRGLWTNGARWEKYEGIIEETFDYKNIVYNDHSHTEGHHQPLMVASQDIVVDKELMWKLIDQCWIQNRWSASITPKGCFFCEVAAAQDMLYNGPGGYPIEPGWWKKTPVQFHDQIERYCVNCCAAIPMIPIDSNIGKDLISPRVARLLEEVDSPRYARGKTMLFDKVMTAEDIAKCQKDWKPWSHRPFRQCGPRHYLDDNDNVVSEKVFHKG